MLTWILRMLLLRRFGGRGLLILGVVNFIRRRLLGRPAVPPGVYSPGREAERGSRSRFDLTGRGSRSRFYQPSQGSSQTAQRDPRY